MKKFFINFEKDKISIIEARCEKITALDDPSVNWTKEDRFKILSLKEKNFQPVWYNFYLFDRLEEAKDYCHYLIVEDFILNFRKNNVKYTDQDIENKIKLIEINLLK